MRILKSTLLPPEESRHTWKGESSPGSSPIQKNRIRSPNPPPKHVWSLIKFIETQEDTEPEDEELPTWLINQARLSE